MRATCHVDIILIDLITLGEVALDTHPSGPFPTQNGLKLGNILSPLFSNFTLECSVRKVHRNYEGTELIGQYQILSFLNTVMFLHFVSLLLLWIYSPLLGLGRFSRFFILYTVGKTPWTRDQPVARPLPTHRTTQIQNKLAQYRHPYLEWDSNRESQRLSERRPFMP
jgi:hypothetical protein